MLFPQISLCGFCLSFKYNSLQNELLTSALPKLGSMLVSIDMSLKKNVGREFHDQKSLDNEDLENKGCRTNHRHRWERLQWSCKRRYPSQAWFRPGREACSRQKGSTNKKMKTLREKRETSGLESSAQTLFTSIIPGNFSPFTLLSGNILPAAC